MGRVEHIKGRPTKYRSSLKKNDYWNTVRRKVKVRDKHRCRLCGSRKYLEVHHDTYKVDTISIVGRELEFLSCLTTLCEDCHQKVHQNNNHPLNPRNYERNKKTG